MDLRHDPVVYKHALSAYTRVVNDRTVMARDILRRAHEVYNANVPDSERLNLKAFNSVLITLHGINSRIRRGHKPKYGLYTWDQETRKMFPFENRLKLGKRRHRMGRLAKHVAPDDRVTGVRGMRFTEPARDQETAPADGLVIDIRFQDGRGVLKVEGPGALVSKLISRISVQ